MTEQFSHIESGTLVDASTKLNNEKKVKDSISSPTSQIDPSQTKGISLIKNPKQESKTDYLDNLKEFLFYKRSLSFSETHASKHLSGYGLTQLPKDLKDWNELKELNLSNNPLSHLDTRLLGYVFSRSLQKLDLSGCGLTELPDGLNDCCELKELNLSNNPLGHSGTCSLRFVNGAGLRKLDLSGCGLTKLPMHLDDYNKLEELNVSNNPLGHSGTCSLGFVNGAGLRKLDLSGCGLTKLPMHLGDYNKLKELNVSNNPLGHSGTRSLRFVNGAGLRKLDLSGCGLTKLPMHLDDYNKLEELNVSNNPLGHSGTCSLRFVNGAGLRKLDLSGCGLTDLHIGLHDYNKLEELNVSNNPLGHIDIPLLLFVNESGLRKLDMSGCGLTELPMRLDNCNKLEELNLSNNPKIHSAESCLKRCSYSLKKLDLSGCGLTKLPNLNDHHNLHELNFSNNSFDHQDLLEKLNSGKVFSYSGFHQRGKERSELMASALRLSILTCRIIFEDAVYTRSNGVWMVAFKDVASTRYASSTKERYKGQMRVEELNWFSLPNKDIWLDEFCLCRKRMSGKLTIETYHAMLQSLNIVCNLVSSTVERESTLSLSQCCDEILHGFKQHNPASQECISYHSMNESRLRQCISYLKSAVSYLKIWSIQADDDNYQLKQSITISALAFKEAREACLLERSNIEDKILAAKLMIISVMFSNLTEPEAAVLRCLQFLQELHDLDKIREVFSVLCFLQSLQERHINASFLYNEEAKWFVIVKSVRKINKILFEFVRMFFKPPPTVEEWPATIKLGEQIINPLIDGRFSEERLIDTDMAVNLDTVEDDNKVKDPITDITEFGVIKSSGQTPDNSITVNKKGGCFHVPVASAFLLFPPHAVEEEVTLKCSRVKYKECEVKPRDGEFFVSRILKIEPKGVTFMKPVTVLVSHSANEDQDFLYFYELIIKNLFPTGCQELKTERISFIEDVPKQISNEEIFHDYLPFAKATIHETCTLVAATRVRSHQILIPTNRSYAFSKQYGDNAKLKITFPADVTKKILTLKVQLFPAEAVVKKDIRLDKNIVCAPVIRVSGQEIPFLDAVDVELTYSHNDVANIEEEFLSVGKTIQFTTDYGLLLRSQEENGSTTKWANLNESNKVFIERPRKDQLKFSFSVEHFSDINPVVDMSGRSGVPPRDGSRVIPADGVVDMKNQACRDAYVWAVHKTGIYPKTLHSLLAPKQERHDLNVQLKVNGMRFMHCLECEEPVFFCVPMSDSSHLDLKDNTLWFYPDDTSEAQSNTKDSIDLNGEYMHFMKDRECNNGENHNLSSTGDCRAKAPIHISNAGPVQENIVPDIAPRQATGPLSSQGDVNEGQITSKDEDKQEKNCLTCEYFEQQIKKKFLNRLEINENNKEDPDIGAIAKVINDAGTLTCFILSVGTGTTLLLSIGSFGIGSFVGAAVLGATFIFTKASKRKKKSSAKKLDKKVEIYFHSHLRCIIMDVAKELSRMFEYQVLELKDETQIDILAECAVDLMLDLKEGDHFDRNTLLQKILQDGKVEKKGLLTSEGDKWSAPDVFRKPGLRKVIFGKDDAKFEYFIKSTEASEGKKDACDTSTYGYRGQFLLTEYGSKNEEDEKVPQKRLRKKPAKGDGETHAREDLCKELCKECSSNYESTSGEYFVESDIDLKYTESRDPRRIYHPMHILIQCPKVLDSFIGNHLQEKRPSLANFLKSKLPLPEYHLVLPVYRQHSPVKVPDVKNSDFTRSDFSHADFTNSSFTECNFTKCIMLFVTLAQAKMSSSKFRSTLISHSNLEKLEADHCEWTNMFLLYSNVKGAYLDYAVASISGNRLDGTNICDAFTGNDRELSYNEKPAQSKMSGSKLRCDNTMVEVKPDHREGTNTSLLHSNVDGESGNDKKLNCNEKQSRSNASRLDNISKEVEDAPSTSGILFDICYLL